MSAPPARDTAPVDDLLSLAQGHPRRTLEPGDVLVVDGEPVSALFVLLEGELRVEKVGVPIAVVREPGACVGEMSLLLGVPATADVVASERSVRRRHRGRAHDARRRAAPAARARARSLPSGST